MSDQTYVSELKALIIRAFQTTTPMVYFPKHLLHARILATIAV